VRNNNQKNISGFIASGLSMPKKASIVTETVIKCGETCSATKTQILPDLAKTPRNPEAVHNDIALWLQKNLFPTYYKLMFLCKDGVTNIVSLRLHTA